MDEDLMDLFVEWLQKAIDTGSRGTAVEYTASGMAFHMYREMNTLQDDKDEA